MKTITQIITTNKLISGEEARCIALSFLELVEQKDNLSLVVRPDYIHNSAAHFELHADLGGGETKELATVMFKFESACVSMEIAGSLGIELNGKVRVIRSVSKMLEHMQELVTASDEFMVKAAAKHAENLRREFEREWAISVVVMSMTEQLRNLGIHAVFGGYDGSLNSSTFGISSSDLGNQTCLNSRWYARNSLLEQHKNGVALACPHVSDIFTAYADWLRGETKGIEFNAQVAKWDFSNISRVIASAKALCFYDFKLGTLVIADMMSDLKVVTSGKITTINSFINTDQ